MAGSMSWQNYTTNAGNVYSIFCDKSNALSVNPSASPTPVLVNSEGIPRNIRPRYALFRSIDGYTTRKVPVLTPGDLTALTPGTSFVTNPGGVTVFLKSIVSEKVRIPSNDDTGLTT